MVTRIKLFQPGDHEHCERILRLLPDWFGIESSLVQYVKDTQRMPTWLAETDREVSGFITLNRHFSGAAEIHCIAVHPEFHRRGVGRLMVAFAEKHLLDDGCRFLQVKTLGPSRPNKDYAMTRKFYEAMGFVPVEEFLTLWPGNLALMLIKSI